jgi:hypothetical protein
LAVKGVASKNAVGDECRRRSYVLSACESEGRIVVRRVSVRIGMDEVVEGSILVEAMDLNTVMKFEEMKEVVEEVVDLDDGFIGEWR